MERIARAAHACLVSALLIAAQPARADEPPTGRTPEGKVDERVIVTGTKTGGGEFGGKSGIALEEMVQSVQVIDDLDFGTTGIRSVGDLLRAVPSANVGNPRTAPYQSFSLRVRGFLADQMRNGVRQRYYEDIDASALSNVERIEVLKGPSAVLFGQSAQGGIISLVTKRPQRDYATSIGVDLGSRGERIARFDTTGSLSDEPVLSYRLTGEFERSDTHVDSQDMDRDNVGLSMTAQLSDGVTGYLVTEWLSRETQHNPGLPLMGTIQSGERDIPDDRFLSEPQLGRLDSSGPLAQAWLDIELSPDWSLKPRISYSGFKSDFVQIRVREQSGTTIERTGRGGREDDTYWVTQLDLEGEEQWLGVGHRLLGGVEYARERATFRQKRLANVGPIDALDPVYQFDSSMPVYEFQYAKDYDTDSRSVYLQDIVDVTDAWNFVLGARASSFQSRTSGVDTDPLFALTDGVRSRQNGMTYQLGTAYQLADGWSVYGGWNTGFDIESTAGSLSASGSAFEPEESEQFEGGLRFAGEGFAGSLAAFQVSRMNLLTADPLNTDLTLQTGEARVRGLELEGSLELVEGLQLSGGYALMRSKVVDSGNGDEGGELGDTPRHQANLLLRWAVPGTDVELWGGANYVGERALVNDSSIDLSSYFVGNVGASYTWGRTRIDLTLANVLDEEYFTASGNTFSVFPGEPRRAFVRVTQSF